MWCWREGLIDEEGMCEDVLGGRAVASERDVDGLR